MDGTNDDDIGRVRTAGMDMTVLGTPTRTGWTILGPGGGGCVHTLTVNPHRPDTMVVSCDMTAGYITHDGGGSWREFNLKSRQYAYAFDPVDPGVIYAGSSGLFRSHDDGDTWHLLFPDPRSVTGETRHHGDEANHHFLSTGNWPGGLVQAILVDPRQRGRVFIAVKNEGIHLFMSLDDCRTWKRIALIPGREIHRLVLDPSANPGDRGIFAFTDRGIHRVDASCGSARLELPSHMIEIRHASWGKVPGTGEAVFYITAISRYPGDRHECCVWKSWDLGATWRKASSGLEPRIASASSDDQPLFSQVSACEADARRVYLIAERFPEPDAEGTRVDHYGILRSDDEGSSWRWVVKMDDDHDPVNRDFGWAERDYGACHGDVKGDHQISPKGRLIYDVVPDPKDPDVCYTMDFSTIYKTGDGGESWNQLVTQVYGDGSVSSRGMDVLGPYSVFFDPFDRERLVLTFTDVGVWQSFNEGRTWHHALKGVPREWINSCYWMVFDPEVQGRAWSAWSAMHDIPRRKMFKDEYFARDRGGICRTDDGLASWQASNRGMDDHSLCTHLVLDPASPAGGRTLYAAVFNQGVYKSTDDGRTWTPRNEGLDPANPFAWRLALLPDGTLFLVVVKNQLPGRERTGGLYRSRDGAGHWERVALPEGVDFPNDLSFDPFDPRRLYLACWPQVIGGNNRGGGVWVSDDGGQGWQNLFDQTSHAYTLTVDPVRPSTLYLATFDAAVLRSDDRGRSWRRLEGFNFQWAYRPIPDPHHPGMLYISTFGSSVWYGPAEGLPGAVEDIVDEATSGRNSVHPD
jgi:photosystem II stability/assembly factor-like uncharacterized protein